MDHSHQEPTWHKSACNLCYINCGVELGVEGQGTDARIIKVRGDRDNPRSKGYLCSKAQFIPSYVHHRDRLTTPLRRRADGGFDPISWETAISEIAAKLGNIVETHGGRSIGLVGGGGQGNHANGTYANPILFALGCRTVYTAWSQEKTGDAWINGRIFGAQNCHTAESVEECDLLLAIGCNPKIANGFTNAREQLNSIRKDQSRKLIVIDPRRTETADIADLHLAIRPGSDAFLMGALLAELNRRGGFDEKFLAEHAVGADEVKAALELVPIEQWVATAEVAPADFDRLVQMVMDAHAMVVRVELGIQQGLNSTLNSYLEKLLILMTGNFGRPGTNWVHSWLVPMWNSTPDKRHAATGAEVIGGLLSPNLIPASILAEHPERIRVLWVDSSNPVNTAANTTMVKRAIKALDLMVVIDVAMTETAMEADYVLPASSIFEKCEFTYFSFEAPENYFHVRAAVLPPLTGTLPEPEIYIRLARAMDMLPGDDVLAELASKARDPAAFGRAFAAAAASDPKVRRLAGPVLYLTLGQTLPDGVAAAAPLWYGCHEVAKTHTEAVQRALGGEPAPRPAVLGERLFRKLVQSRSGTAFTHHTEVWSLLAHADKKIHVAIPEMFEWMRKLDPASVIPNADYPFVLSAGGRRLHNANQNLRDPITKRSDPDGALYIHPDDLQALGVQDEGCIVVETKQARMIVRAHATDSMRRGHVVLPHGYGQGYPSESGQRVVIGPAINWLTPSDNRDPVADTPHHKFVPARLFAAPAGAVVGTVERLLEAVAA